MCYQDDATPVASFGIKNKNPMGKRVATSCITMPNRRLSKFSEEISSTEANAAPKNEPNVELKLFIDMKSAKSVPSIPGGQSCPDRIRNGINLHTRKEQHHKSCERL